MIKTIRPKIPATLTQKNKAAMKAENLIVSLNITDPLLNYMSPIDI
ncbi:hypothetical protein TUMSATVNIG1_33080 [Vibrio nigripulchritudo]|nr:hypothetical protein VNTUMSATTG_32790 [Vibrio nigripulchritudo]BDU32699.1 hypothetical protein TUMSATVNIG1_33080 [Vibrio nigripulchritudo]